MKKKEILNILLFYVLKLVELQVRVVFLQSFIHFIT